MNQLPYPISENDLLRPTPYKNLKVVLSVLSGVTSYYYTFTAELSECSGGWCEAAVCLSVVAGAGAFSLSCVVCGRHRRGGRGYFITQV